MWEESGACVEKGGAENQKAWLSRRFLQQQTCILLLENLTKALQKQCDILIFGCVVKRVGKNHTVRHIKRRLVLPNF